MKLDPYVSVDDIRFSMPELEVSGLLGEPTRRDTNRKGESQLHYHDCVYRFSASEGFLECSGTWNVVEIDGVAVPTGVLADFVRTRDVEAHEVLGFLVSLRYGISLDLEHAGHITAFRLGRWDKVVDASNTQLHTDAPRR